jgi:hypothetical protein
MSDSPGYLFRAVDFQMAVLAHGRPLGFFGVASDTKIVYFVFPLAALVALSTDFYPVIVSVFVMTGETVYAGLFVLEMGDFNLAHQPPGFDHSGLEVRIGDEFIYRADGIHVGGARIDRGRPLLATRERQEYCDYRGVDEERNSTSPVHTRTSTKLIEYPGYGDRANDVPKGDVLESVRNRYTLSCLVLNR